MIALPLLAVWLSACAPEPAEPDLRIEIGALDAPAETGALRLSMSERVPPAADVASALFPEAKDAATVAECDALGSDAARERCLFEALYGPDAAALELALDLYADTGTAAGVVVERDFDGHYRGMIHLVPQAPLGEYRTHLSWVAAGLRDQAEILDAIAAIAPEPIVYRHTDLELRFFRSVGRRTPSAIASGWTVSYNVSGSLNTSELAVRDTLIHEIFHLNERARGSWADLHLRAGFDTIVAACGTSTSCLAPYAPGTTRVRGGTWYAFQPNNGDVLREYAAELALRWFREQRLALAGTRIEAPFKCGPPENAAAWQALTDEFFGGADAVPSCSETEPPPGTSG